MRRSEKALPFKHISDTARFVALLRAMEGDRKDALYQDPFARKLAGPDAEKMMSFFKKGRARFDHRTMAVRTKILDEMILHVVREERVDTVLNLAAGLDTRPYRMDLPATLRWIEADFAPILTEKEIILKNEIPRCQLERVKLDLREKSARQELFAYVAGLSKKTLVLTEGFLMYLTPETVSELGKDLHSYSNFQFWLTDMLSELELSGIKKRYGKQFKAGNATPHFALTNPAPFFEKLGYQLKEERSLLTEALRLRREPRWIRNYRVLSPLAGNRWRAAQIARYRFLLFQREN